MNKNILSIVFLGLIVHSFAQIQSKLPELIKKVDPSVVKIYTLDSKNEYASQGSGVLV